MGISESDFRSIRERMGLLPAVLAAEGDGVKAKTKRRGVPNKWEAQFAAEVLEPQLRAGFIDWYGFEWIKLRLADGAWYTPDFISVRACEKPVVHEVKGFFRSRDRVRVKVAADRHPWLTLIVVTRDRDTGEWKYEKIGK